MLDRLKTAFPQIGTEACLQTLTASEFHIYDHETEKRCYIQIASEGVRHFTVKNTDGRSIHFLAIDKCLLMDDELTQRCDCAVFDDQTFCFIEIKTTSSDNDRRRAKCRKKASDQLKATIVHFRNKVSFDASTVEAYVTLITESISEDGFAELQPKPRVRANLTEKIAEFDEMGVVLLFDNWKKFT